MNKTAKDSATHHPNRHPPLKGGINFRDFGGYATADGGRVKWNKLFRSGHLANLTPDDHAHLDGVGLGAICDFRTDWENDREQTKLPDHIQDRMVRFNIWPTSAKIARDMVQELHEGRTDDDEIYERQNAVYREFIREFSNSYAAMFRHILAAEGRAVLIHCAGGKDRTGIGAALIHAALGVPEDTIHDDYILTNANPRTVKFIRIMTKRAAELAGESGEDAAEAQFDRFMRLFGARADSLQAAFETMHELGGSMDGYLRDVLKVTDSEREKLLLWYVDEA